MREGQNMPRLRFAIDFQEKDMGEDGVDAVAFLMSANVGEALRPIQKIASGASCRASCWHSKTCWPSRTA